MEPEEGKNVYITYMEDKDLAKFLLEWEYGEDDNIRFFTTPDGREIMQVRLPLGVEQFELKGRPDGKKIDGKDSALAAYQDRLKKGEEKADPFSLSTDDLKILQQEGLLYYFRYLILFQTRNYGKVMEDTAHNLALCDLVERYCSDEARYSILQYKPYIYRIHAVSHAMIEMEAHNISTAQSVLEKAIDELNRMPPVPTPLFELEKKRGQEHITGILKQMETFPVSKKEQLNAELHKAVEIEDYERAAKLRDQLRELSEST